MAEDVVKAGTENECFEAYFGYSLYLKDGYGLWGAVIKGGACETTELYGNANVLGIEQAAAMDAIYKDWIGEVLRLVSEKSAGRNVNIKVYTKSAWNDFQACADRCIAAAEKDTETFPASISVETLKVPEDKEGECDRAKDIATRMHWESLKLGEKCLLPEERKTVHNLSGGDARGGAKGWRSCVRLDDLEERDYQEAISSAMVRALQDKTQMMTDDNSAMSRTRLTHSLEVSNIARSLAHAVNYIFEKNKGYRIWDDEQQQRVMRVLANAGLLHDLGNPPFGHEGEDALGEEVKKWCKSHKSLFGIVEKGEKVEKDEETDLMRDLGHVEGNSQALRYLIHPNPLTTVISDPSLELLVSITKYTIPCSEWDAVDKAAKKGDKEKEPIWRHKAGCYLSEKKDVENAQRQLGIARCREDSNNRQYGEYVRYPLAYLLEAADDIAYRTSDLLDGYIAGKIGADDLADVADKLSERKSGDKEYSSANKELAGRLRGIPDSDNPYASFPVVSDAMMRLRESLIYNAAYEFVENYGRIMSGEYGGELVAGWSTKDILKQVKDLTPEHVYTDPEVRRQRDRGKEAVRYVFRHCAACIDGTTGRFVDLEGKDVPGKFKAYVKQVPQGAYGGDNASNAYQSMRVVLDYVSSLTDRGVIELEENMERLEAEERARRGVMLL